MEPVKLYNLEWWVDGQKKETIDFSKSFAICSWKRKQLEETTHTTGKLVIQPVDSVLR